LIILINVEVFMRAEIINEAHQSSTMNDVPTWEERSGFLMFLSLVPQEVERFNQTFEFNIKSVIAPPLIDDNREARIRVGFVLVRYNSLLPESRYCLYSILQGRELHGYIGIYSEDGIETIMKLKPITNFKEGRIILFDWLRGLVRASYEKIMV